MTPYRLRYLDRLQLPAWERAGGIAYAISGMLCLLQCSSRIDRWWTVDGVIMDAPDGIPSSRSLHGSVLVAEVLEGAMGFVDILSFHGKSFRCLPLMDRQKILGDKEPELKENFGDTLWKCIRFDNKFVLEFDRCGGNFLLYRPGVRYPGMCEH